MGQLLDSRARKTSLVKLMRCTVESMLTIPSVMWSRKRGQLALFTLHIDLKVLLKRFDRSHLLNLFSTLSLFPQHALPEAWIYMNFNILA